MRLAKHGADLLYTSRRIYETMTGAGLQVRRQHGVSRVQQLAQIIHYRRRLGAGGSEYYMFELYRPDMSDAARGRFLTQLAWNALSRVLNQPDRKSDDSKLALSRHFAKAGIPTPRTLGYTAFAPTDVHRAAPEFIPLSELGRLIPPNGCVLKRDRSTWGRGVLVFKSFDRGILEHVDGRRLDIHGLGELLREQGGGFLLQERLENHPDLAALGLPSLATLRVLTYGGGDDIRIARAALKFPIGRKGVDNYHAGGIAAPVDLASGKVGGGIGSQGMEWLSVHPETGKQFQGMVVPHWNDVIVQTIRAAKSMPDFRCVGWDVVVTATSVHILEGNSVWATELVQRPHRAGIWEGDFRRWCLDVVGDTELPSNVRRWLGLRGAR